MNIKTINALVGKAISGLYWTKPEPSLDKTLAPC